MERRHYYAFADIHGIYELWAQIRDYVQPQDVLIFLGDAIDRGPDGIKIMQELLENPKVIYIRGNHEDMMIDAWENPISFPLWKANGSDITYKSLMELSKNERVELISKLKYTTRKYTVYNNREHKKIILTHAGFNPDIDNDMDNSVWNRKHIAESWSKNPELDNTILVHGHTIAWTLNKYDKNINPDCETKAITYCDGHKIDIDMGTVKTLKTCLLDLDTLQPIYFTIEK